MAETSNSGDWRSKLRPEDRKNVVNKVIDSLVKNLRISRRYGRDQLEEIALRYEDKMYNVATSLQDYILRISRKLQTIETMDQGTTGVNPSHSNPSVGYQSSTPPGSAGVPPSLYQQQQSPNDLHPWIQLQLQLMNPQHDYMQKQQSFLQLNQLQASQQPLIQVPSTSTIQRTQPAMMHSAPEQNLQHNQQEVPPNTITNQLVMQHSQMSGQPSYVPDLQQQQTHERSSGNGPQNNISLLNQEQLLLSQSSVSSMKSYQRDLQMLSSQSETQQRNQQPFIPLFKSEGHQSQQQSSQRQLMPQILPRTQLAMQQHQNSLNKEIQQKSDVTVESQYTMEQQNLSSESDLQLQEVSSTNYMDSTAGPGCAVDRQEMYHKIQRMKNTYLPELNEQFEKLKSKIDRESRLPPGEQSHQFGTMKRLLSRLENVIKFLDTNKNYVRRDTNEKIHECEEAIKYFLCLNRRTASSQLGSQAIM